MDWKLELFQISFVKVTLFDVLDIAIMSWIFYKLYHLVRGTRAAQMAFGLVLILATSTIVQFLNLSGLTWIFQNLRTIWLLAFVILFQPELRRILIHLGQSRLVRFLVRVSENRVIKEVVDATFDLAKRGYGGLIVMVGDTGIKSVSETGVPVRAEVSAPLIISLFNPRSPLHDGAIVIQNDVVEAAKCILPLSDQPDLDPFLGTRHRAALGMSEESDAAVIVVSEESSVVSLAQRGSLERHLSPERLSEILFKAFGVGEQ